MLFSYPEEAIANNWFHECLTAMLESVFDRLQIGDQPIEWPIVIPLEYRTMIGNRPALRNHWINLVQEITGLIQPERDQVREALRDQNRIPELLNCDCDCPENENLPLELRERAKQFFNKAFEAFSSFDLRQQHYTLCYEAHAHKVCAFCGCEEFSAPGGLTEDLDHYLCKSRFSFAAVNLRNLVPMGPKCNQKVKRSKNILRDDNGDRRKAFYPYSQHNLTMSLNQTNPFPVDKDFFSPDWVITFEEDTEEVQTWNSVFEIRERYERDFLDIVVLRSWLDDFARRTRRRVPQPQNREDLLPLLAEYASDYEQKGYRERAFIKGPVFRFLQEYCENGPERERLAEFLLEMILQ